MTEPSRHPDSSPDTTRRWVRVVVIIAILLVAVMLLSGGGGGGHGPSRHI